MPSADPSRAPVIAIATLIVGVLGALVAVLGTASRSGLTPEPRELLIGAAIGLALGAVASPLGIWVGRTRRLSRVLPLLLFLPLGVCVSLGPFGNAPLTITGALLAYALGAVALAFFVREHAHAQRRCPVCNAPVTTDDDRCPACAVRLDDA